MLNNDSSSVLDLVDEISQSVVNVSTVRLVNHVFYRAVPMKGMGSGTIFDSNGKILTNNHVIDGAKEITVTLKDGRVLNGKSVGNCPQHDIAIIQVKEKDLPVAKLGDSDRLRVGERVFAVGNPFGLAGGPTVTSGVISALNRSIKSKRFVMENLVQTDAAINPGNSGGPLVDECGRVIAINTAIIPYAQGIGFAIPINSAKNCKQEILVNGNKKGASLGISGLSITEEMARYYDFRVDRGVFIVEIIPGSAAKFSGIIKGDIILDFDGKSIGNIEELVKALKNIKFGKEHNIRILRNSRILNIKVIF
jgi:S1-C subfamily serine protease